MRSHIAGRPVASYCKSAFIEVPGFASRGLESRRRSKGIYIITFLSSISAIVLVFALHLGWTTNGGRRRHLMASEESGWISEFVRDVDDV